MRMRASYGRLIPRLAASLLMCAIAACHSAPPAPAPRQSRDSVTKTEANAAVAFRLDEQAVKATNFRYRNGQEAEVCSIVESLGGGVGLLDFDRDGWLDACLPGGGAFAEKEL